MPSIATGPKDVATFIMSAVGNSYLDFFQDSNPCRELFSTLTASVTLLTSFTAIGLYITIS